MATSKGGNGTTATDDLLSGIVEDEPIARASSERERETFQPVPALIEAIGKAFGEGKAVKIKRTFSTESDARKGAKVYLLHALEVAEHLDPPKSAAIRVTPVNAQGATLADPKDASVAGWVARVQLTHKRQSKADSETPAEGASETPASE